MNREELLGLIEDLFLSESIKIDIDTSDKGESTYLNIRVKIHNREVYSDSTCIRLSEDDFSS